MSWVGALFFAWLGFLAGLIVASLAKLAADVSKDD